MRPGLGKYVKISPDTEESAVVGYDVSVGGRSILDHVISDTLSLGKKTAVADTSGSPGDILPIAFPELGSCGPVSGPDMVISTHESGSISEGSYNKIEIKRSSEATFAGGTYEVNTFSVGHNAVVYFDGPTTIRVRKGDIDMSSGGSFNPDGTRSVIIKYCGEDNITTEKSFKACIFAPNGKITLKGQYERFEGQFIAREISVGKGNELYLNACFGDEEPPPPTPPPPPPPPPEPELLEVSCKGMPRRVMVDETVTWAATASGGTGEYVYEWSGAVSGSTQSVEKSYSAPGKKYATVTVTSGDQQEFATCEVRVKHSYCQYSRFRNSEMFNGIRPVR